MPFLAAASLPSIMMLALPGCVSPPSTCFFVRLPFRSCPCSKIPPYSSLAVMKERLRIAVKSSAGLMDLS